MRLSDPALVDRLASAYVLGTLSAGARRRFERVRAVRPDVALAVSAWEARLAQLASSVPAAVPSARVWDSIAHRTRPRAATSPTVGQVAPRRWWLFGAGAGGMLAGALAAMALLMASPALFLTADRVAMQSGEKLPASYVGLLTDTQGNGKLLVSSLRHGRTMTVKVIGPIEPRGAGKQLVLWAVPAEGAPFVLGTSPVRGSAVAQLPDTSEKLLSKVTKLIVTEETTATPTTPGPTVFAGNCAKLW